MQHNHLAGLALMFLTVWNTWGFGWGPKSDDHEDRKEAVTAGGDKADQVAITAGDDEADEKVDDYMDAVEDCLDEADTLEAAKDCSEVEP